MRRPFIVWVAVVLASENLVDGAAQASLPATDLFDHSRDLIGNMLVGHVFLVWVDAHLVINNGALQVNRGHAGKLAAGGVCERGVHRRISVGWWRLDEHRFRGLVNVCQADKYVMVIFVSLRLDVHRRIIRML